ncbi:MAG: hypothetical protein K1X72_24440 [Pyrinomonadaceae bacterium]|nr:hypothetical protein [Pyrinomonadaceae bacterium]
MKKATEMNKVVELTQDTAKATLDATVGTAKLAEDSIQGLYKVGYDMNAAGLKVAKGYWDALSSIRNEWINLFEQTGEKAVDSIGALNSIEVPFQKEMNEFGANFYAQGEKVFNMAADQVKAVTKNVTAQFEKVTATATKEAKKATENVSAKAEKATEKAAKVTKDVVATAENVAEKATAKVEDAAAKAKKATAK